MADNFLSRMKKQAAGAGSLSAQTLIEESGTGAILHAGQAAAEGRLLTLHPDQLEPDPLQPRRAFHPDSILTLQKDIETNGQLQPILVGRPNPDGTYPIIFGERRWRAIAQSPTLDSVVAVLRGDDLDDATIVLLQISENTQREGIAAIEQAHAINRFVTLCKQHGRKQHDAAEALHMSTARLSKFLALLRAPDAIQELSAQGEIQDLEVLYALAKAFQEKPQETTALLDKWRHHEVPTSLRHAVTQLTAADEPGAPHPGSDEPQHHQEQTHPQHTPTTASIVQRASAVGLQSTDTETHLIIEVGRKKLCFSLDPDAYRHLKDSPGNSDADTRRTQPTLHTLRRSAEPASLCLGRSSLGRRHRSGRSGQYPECSFHSSITPPCTHHKGDPLMTNRHPQEDDFPPIDFGEILDQDDALSASDASGHNGEPTPAAGRPRGQNRVRPNDSLTRCPGFINAIQQHETNGKTYYSIRVGLLQGSKKNEKDEWIGDITNCYLLLGPTLRKWAETMHGLEDPFHGVRCLFTIRNLKFYLGTHNDEPVVRSRGALETITFGHLIPTDRA